MKRLTTSHLIAFWLFLCPILSIGQTNVSDSLELVNFYNTTCNTGNCALVWDFNQPVDTWDGIDVSNGRVIIIDITSEGLTGQLPDFNLPYLREIDFDNNSFNGTIPNFTYLDSLEILYLDDNSFSGAIPDFENFLNLTVLDLDGNELIGPIPNFNLPNLIELDLSYNSLTGTIPNFNNSTSLEEMNLSENQLTGSVPDFSNLINLRIINFYDNDLVGAVPDFANLTNLTYISLGRIYGLTGSVPDFANLVNLTYINLERNDLTGVVPDFSTLTNLQELYLGINDLTGTIPDFSNLVNLEYLHLNGNELMGLIPNFNLPNLRELYLDGNQLSGTIPNFNLPNLRELYLDGNQLNGTIPNFALSYLRELDLGYNQLTGTIPDFNLSDLEWLYLDQNQLGGAIPYFDNLGSLERLYLDYNQLTGTIPDFNLPTLERLDLGGNELTGIIPDFENLTSLTDIDLSNNQLVGCFSPELSDLCLIDYNFINNPGLPGNGNFNAFCLYGFGSCDNLDSLELVDFYIANCSSDCLFSWDLNEPMSTWAGITLSNSNRVTAINLPSMGLTGTIPYFNLPNLTFLNLSDNQLSGLIPDFEYLTNLITLRLNGNQLVGLIPNFGNLPNLQKLYLFNNQLCGEIPNFSNLTNLETISLGENQLDGEIPEFSNLPNLDTLVFNNNQLSGEIPSFINSPNIKWLFLQNNQLTGAIPDFVHLTDLDSLVLSNNQLSGCFSDSMLWLCGVNCVFSNNSGLPNNGDFQSYCSTGVGQCYTDQSDSLELVNFYNTNCNNGCTLIWDFDQPVNTWQGVTTWNGRVTEIILHYRGLSGNLPDINLPHLEKLSLYVNQFSGNLPDFNNVSNLRYLDLRFNQLTGEIPDLISLPNLIYLYLSSNQLSGVIPNFNHLPPVLHLNNNLIEGCFSELLGGYCYVPAWQYNFLNNPYLPGGGDFTSFCNSSIGQCYVSQNDSLELIDFYNATCNVGCTLYWDIAQPVSSWDGIVVWNGRVSEMHLSGKGLSGNIPDINLPELERLNLNSNQLSGQIPDFYLPNLEYLYLEFCELTGYIPDFTGLNNLKWLRLNSNEQLGGTIPNFSGLPNLTRFYAVDCQLSGEVPNFTGLNNLEIIQLLRNQLTGTIPNFNLPNLIMLDLKDNQLTGTIPDFTSMPLLTYLQLSNNQLSGVIPDFNSLPNLIDVELRSNQLTGTIPNFSYLPLLTELNLSSNELTGTVLDFTDLPNLERLYISGNKLSGSMPNLVNLPNLTHLSVSNNDLTDTIPDFTGLLNLEYLYLGSNDWTGGVTNFTNLPKLEVLALGSGNLTGNIPDFTNLYSLERLYLNNNKLTGVIPNFATLTNLTTIEIHDNELSGIIPDFTLLPLIDRVEIENNLFSFEDMDENFDNNIVIDYFEYSPQYHGEVQSYIVEEGDTLTMGLSYPLSGNNNQNVNYQWRQNDGTLNNATDSTYNMTNLQLSNLGKYTLHMTDDDRVPDLEIISEPIYVMSIGYDLYGQRVEYSQIMVEFDDWTDKEFYEEEYLYEASGWVGDSCSCNRLLYLWQFPDDTLALEVLLNINTKKEEQTEDAEIDGGPNSIFTLVESSMCGIGWDWEGTYTDTYPDSVLVYIMDSGLDAGGWDPSPYLMNPAPLDSCHTMAASGYNYTDTLSNFDTNYIDSIGHGTFGFRAVTEDLDDYMDLKVVPLKVFDEKGEGTLFKFVCALYHAIDHGADIVNISAGYSGQPSSILEGAIQKAQEKGVFIVTAVGNEGVNIDSFPQYPAYYAGDFYETVDGDTIYYDNVISVASINADSTLSDFSNYGVKSATLSAYGEDMTGYGIGGVDVISSGTSIATFYVTHELAVEIAKNKNLDYKTIWSNFESSSLVSSPFTTDSTRTGKQLDLELFYICDPVRTLTGNIDEGVYQAGCAVKFSGVISEGNNVNFKAGENIILELGAEIREGATFTGEIGQCDGDGN